MRNRKIFWSRAKGKDISFICKKEWAVASSFLASSSSNPRFREISFSDCLFRRFFPHLPFLPRKWKNRELHERLKRVSEREKRHKTNSIFSSLIFYLRVSFTERESERKKKHKNEKEEAKHGESSRKVQKEDLFGSMKWLVCWLCSLLFLPPLTLSLWVNLILFHSHMFTLPSFSLWRCYDKSSRPQKKDALIRHRLLFLALMASNSLLMAT